MNSIYIKDNSFIRKAYKRINEHNSIDRMYFILVDGSVICIDGTNIKENPAYKLLPNLKHSIMRYGGKCRICDNIMIGNQFKDNLEWEFSCTECSNKIIFSDNRVDEIVFNALNELDNQINME